MEFVHQASHVVSLPAEPSDAGQRSAHTGRGGGAPSRGSRCGRTAGPTKGDSQDKHESGNGMTLGLGRALLDCRCDRPFEVVLPWT